MVGKKGYIRTLEAVIAIVIILLFIFTVTPDRITNPKKVPPQVESSQKYILQQIANSEDPDYRTEVINAADGLCGDDVEADPPISGVALNVDLLVFENVPPGFDYVCAICSTTSCVFTPEGITTSIYMDDIMITPDNINDGPRIVRLWFWTLPG